MSEYKASRIIVFGASTSHGFWDEKGGWADRLKQCLHKRTLEEEDFYGTVYNLGISGGTTEDILKKPS